MKTAALVSFTLFAFAGCIDQMDPADPSDPDLALETGCTTGPVLGGTDQYVSLPITGTAAATSAKYNQGGCFPGSFVVEIDNTFGRNLTPYSQYAGPAPTNQTGCEATIVTASAFVHSGNDWYPLGQTTFKKGVWIPILHSGTCLVPTVTFSAIHNSSFDKVSVVGSAGVGSTLVAVTDAATAN